MHDEDGRGDARRLLRRELVDRDLLAAAHEGLHTNYDAEGKSKGTAGQSSGAVPGAKAPRSILRLDAGLKPGSSTVMRLAWAGASTVMRLLRDRAIVRWRDLPGLWG